MMTIKHKLFHGTTYISQKVASNFIMLRLVRRWIGEAMTPERELARKWLGYPDTARGVRSIEGVVGLQHHMLELVERYAELLVGLGVVAAVGACAASFNRAVPRGKVFCTEKYGKMHKRNSYVLATKYGNCSVQNIVFCSANTSLQAFIVIKLFETTAYSYHSSIRHILTVRQTNTTMLCRSSDIYGTVVVAHEGSDTKVCALQPNRYEKD